MDLKKILGKALICLLLMLQAQHHGLFEGRQRFQRFFNAGRIDAYPVYFDLAIQPTQVANLALVTAGSFAETPAELLSGDRMQQLVQFVSDAYDLVLLDTPPVLAAAESMALATLVDGVVLVVRAGQTDRHEARQAVRQLADVGAEILGAVLNDPDSTAAQYGYRYRYYGGVAS